MEPRRRVINERTAITACLLILASIFGSEVLFQVISTEPPGRTFA